MARQKGMLNLSGNLEPLAGAPLDSRTITPTVADLYIASNWPYKYIGMKTTVVATGDTYRLVDLDVTQESSWVLDGGSGGQTIQVESMPMATESDLGRVLQYIGTTDLNYTNGYFYKCVYKNSSYLWEQHNVQPDAEGQTIQVSELPTAAIGQVGKIYQYIGQDGGGAIHGYFYECVALQGGGYGWLETEVSAPTEELSSSDMEDVKGAFAPAASPILGFNPMGTIISYYGTTAPAGYLACDGATYNRSAYPALAKYLTDNFPDLVGDGSTTFKVPDLRGEFLRGTGTNSHTNQGNGANVGVHQDATSLRTDLLLKSNSTDIWHYVYLNGNTPDEGLVDAKYTDKFESATPQTYARAKYTVEGTQESGNVYRTTRPTNTSVLYCIKY